VVIILFATRCSKMATFADNRPLLTRTKSTSEKEVKTVTLEEDIYLYITKTKKPYKRTFEVECNRFTQLKFTLDLHKSRNIRVFKYDSGRYVVEPSMVIVTRIRPFSRTEIGFAEVRVEHESYDVNRHCRWKEETPDQEEVERYMMNYRATMTRTLAETKAVPFPSQAVDPDNNLTVAMWKTYGRTFVDVDFPPNEKSIFLSESDVLSHNDGDRDKLVKFQNIEWKRAVDFMKGEGEHAIDVFHSGIESADIIQGSLGDCWFLSALGAIAEHPILVESLFPSNSSHSYQSAGVYTVRICKNGIWQPIRIDDYFPCYPGGGPIFSKCNGNELWVLLMEKAFAKCHGNYVAIQSGWPYEALLDLTGAPSKYIDLPDPEKITESSKLEEIWSEMSKGCAQQFILAASTRSSSDIRHSRYGRDSNNIGLVFNHAYTILDVRMTSRGDRIVKLR
jgi:hypothetical protein